MEVFTRENLGQIYTHACQTYPEECCGFVYADGTIHIGTNIQNELNQKYPDTYKRIGTNGYTFSIPDTVALNNSFRGTNPAVLIYHSHPDVGAYFSSEDRDKAIFNGIPIYPVKYLVIDVRDGVVHEAMLFEWASQEFICTKIFQTNV